MKDRSSFGMGFSKAMRGVTLLSATVSLLLFIGACGDDETETPPEELQDDGRRWCLQLGYEYTYPVVLNDKQYVTLREHYQHAYCATTTSQSGTCLDECSFRGSLKTCDDETIGACPYNQDNLNCIVYYKNMVGFGYQGTTCEGLSAAPTVPTLAELSDVNGLVGLLGSEEAAAPCIALAAQCPKLFDFVANPYTDVSSTP